MAYFLSIFPFVLAVLLLLTLLKMPPAYNQIVGIVATLSFIFFAYHQFQAGSMLFAIIFGLLAILYQPIQSINLGRTGWLITTIFAALFLIWVHNRGLI
jgi:hypothetical protein